MVSDEFSEIKVEVGASFLLAKIRFSTLSKCEPSRKRLDVGMLLFSMKANELSRHILETHWFTLKI